MDILNQLLQEITPVYNRYLNGDFQVGADNLNPKRELQQDSRQSMDAMRLALFLKYKGQFLAPSGDGTSPAPSDLGIPYVNRTQISSPVTLREGMPPAFTPVPIEHDLYNILKAINGFLGGSPVTLSDLPFDICSDFPHPAYAIEPAPVGTSSSTPGGSVITSGLSGSNNTGSSNIASNGGAASAADIKCAMIELGMLQIVFQLIKWVKAAIAAERWALAYIYPYIELAQEIAACYLNPAMLQQVILSLAGQGTAILIGLLTEWVSQFLSSLNLDCLLSEVMGVVQEILGTINGVGDLGSAVGSFVNFNAKAIAATEKYAGIAVQASQGNTTALYDALGIPPGQQSSAATMNAGSLFNLALASGLGAVNSIKNTAIGNVAAVAGTAVSALTNLGKGLNTAANDVTGSAKLIKDYFPGGQFSTF